MKRTLGVCAAALVIACSRSPVATSPRAPSTVHPEQHVDAPTVNTNKPLPIVRASFQAGYRFPCFRLTSDAPFEHDAYVVVTGAGVIGTARVSTTREIVCAPRSMHEVHAEVEVSEAEALDAGGRTLARCGETGALVCAGCERREAPSTEPALAVSKAIVLGKKARAVLVSGRGVALDVDGAGSLDFFVQTVLGDGAIASTDQSMEALASCTEVFASVDAGGSEPSKAGDPRSWRSIGRACSTKCSPVIH